VTSPDWRDAACAGHPDPDLWFPERNGKRARAAIAICGGCPVRAACLATSRIARAEYGIWGGLTESERKAEHAPVARTARPAPSASVAPRRGTPRPKPRGAIVHGTKPGYDRHRERSEPACSECLAAKAEYSRQRRVARKKAAA